MNQSQYKKLNKAVEKAIAEIEDNLTKEGEDLFSAEVQDAITKVKEAIITKAGFTLEEYEKADKEANEEKEIDEDGLLEIAKKTKDKLSKNKEALKKDREEFDKNVDELKGKIDRVDKKIISYDELDQKPHIPDAEEIQAVAKKEIAKIPKPKQLTEKDIEKIVAPMIPTPPDIPFQDEFEQKNIKSLKQDQIDYDFKKKDKEIEGLKKEQAELKDNLNKAIADMGSGGGSTSNRGGRFFNWGMPDKGSYKTAIPDDRYAQSKDVGAFVDDEVPTGVVNGSNKTFTIADTPMSGSVKLFVNGQRQILTTDYSITGTTITTVVAYPTGTLLRVDYRK